MKKLLLLIILINCTFISKSQPCALVEISSSQQLTLPECNRNDGSIVLFNTIGGTPPYSYELGGINNQFGSFFDLSVGVYQAIIKDARSCADTIEINLLYSDIEKIISPDNAFTPNEDDINDTWIIRGIDSFEGSEVRVFNRWGQLVHQNSEYSNEMGWDGKQNGSKLPPATYYYVISIINNCLKESLNGTVTIIR